MKILILANDDAGLFKFRKELLDELVKHYEVYVSVPDGEYVEDIKAIRCKIVVNNFLFRRGTNLLQDLRLIWHYSRIIKKVQPGIVLTYTIKPNVYGGMVCRWLHVPYVANVTGLGTSIENGGVLRKIALKLYKIGLGNAQKVFFQNTDNRDYFLNKGIVKQRYEVLPGSGVNTKQHCYEEYPADTEELVFSVIGRIMRDKGIDEVLSAVRLIKTDYPLFHFRLIGVLEEDYQSKIKEAVQEGVLEYIETQKDIHPIIKESHAVIHASYHEGMSNVLLESASTGRPVIATNVPGCKETYEDGVTGIGFNPKNTEDLVRALREFISLPYEAKASMGKAGRKKIEKSFDRGIVVEKYMREIEAVEASFHS